MVRILLILSLLVSNIAIAEPRVAAMQENDKAPYAGYLLDYEAFATLRVEKEQLIQRCTLEKKFIEDKCKIEIKYLQEAPEPTSSWKFYLGAGVGSILGISIGILTQKFLLNER